MKRFLALFVVATFIMTTFSVVAVASPVSAKATSPPAAVLSLPMTVRMSVSVPTAGASCYFFVFVNSLKFRGWCIDTALSITNTQVYTGKVYSSYGALPEGVAPDHPENLDLVNWIINQNYVGRQSPGGYGAYTYGDVQRSIWTLLENVLIDNELGVWHSDRVNEIVSAALAKGDGFVPAAGQKVAVVLDPVDSFGDHIAQAVIIEASMPYRLVNQPSSPATAGPALGCACAW